MCVFFVYTNTYNFFNQNNIIVHCEGDGGTYNHAISKFTKSKSLQTYPKTLWDA